jgi:hypothetical protein
LAFYHFLISDWNIIEARKYFFARLSLKVGFVFTAIETGPTIPGWVSFAFSDGYTNAGTLTNGSILLH